MREAVSALADEKGERDDLGIWLFGYLWKVVSYQFSVI
jgi:hypothetical protein